jgi:UDP-N-acetylmuramoyl-tripeptide--D-alanyl-D-alanine ligase
MKNTLKNIVIWIIELEARLVLKKYKPRIVAITGSVGKTSTKDAVYAVLSKFFFVRKSEKSLNSEIGLPLTVLGCPNAWDNAWGWFQNIMHGFWLLVLPHSYPKWLVLEVGVGTPGDMKRTASWLYADIVVFTHIGNIPVHVEFFKSVEHLIEEKSLLLHTLKKTGAVVLNADDPAVLNLKNKTKNKVITYGFNQEAMISASNEKILYERNVKGGFDAPKGVMFRINYHGNSVPAAIEGVFGKNYIYAALIAGAIANYLDLNMIESVSALSNYELAPGRMRIIDGVKNTLIVDDTYNSSPAAAEAALDKLSEIQVPGRKIAVLGDMLELGRHTEEAHRKLGELAADVANILVTVGKRAQFIVDGAMAKGMSEKNIFQFGDSREAGKFIEGIIKKGDLILVKGSQGVRMEKTVEEIMADPMNKAKLLVRQEEAWMKR